MSTVVSHLLEVGHSRLVSAQDNQPYNTLPTLYDDAARLGGM